MSRGKMIFTMRSAMTLTELMIASALVGIVTLGLVAAEFTVRNSRQSSARENQVSAQLQSAMLQLSRDVSLLVGDASDTGIVINTSGNDQTICFREAAGDPNLYSDDLWNCWWYKDSTKELTSCRQLAGPPPTTCLGQANKKMWIKITNGSTFYSLVPSATQIDYILLDLATRYDATSADTSEISNPGYQIQSKINPPGLSR